MIKLTYGCMEMVENADEECVEHDSQVQVCTVGVGWVGEDVNIC